MKRKKDGFGWIIVLLLAVIVLLGGYAYVEEGGRLPFLPQPAAEPEAVEALAPVGDAVPKAALPDVNDLHLHENKRLYENDDDLSIVTMYLTIHPGNAAENTDHTWEEINFYSTYDYDRMGVPRYQVSALLQVGDENGPIPGELGYGETLPNATVQVRGQTSSKLPQKNYKIEVKENHGTWRNQRTIALNKHMSEGLRFRNKLAYDLLEEIPQLMALRTQFVHLYVRDLCGENPNAFVDHGLYTQVEQLNRAAMRAHGLDRNGHLYKINVFEFYRYEDTIMLETDPAFDAAAFNRKLEIKGDTDHTKLIHMLEELNDVSIPIDTVLKRHFDRENLAYWMAFQILTGNVDTTARNVYLYSPKNSNTWYLIPWDNDVAFKRYEYDVLGASEATSWQVGVSNYWGNVLFRRCLKSTAFRQELDVAIHELLGGVLSPAHVAEMGNAYAEVIRPYIYRMPDIHHALLTPAQYDDVLEKLPMEIERSYQLYEESLLRPMPFFISVPAEEEDRIALRWENAYDLRAQDVTYEVLLTRDPLGKDVIHRWEDVVIPELKIDPLEPGQYFLHVTAFNEDGYAQEAFDYYVANSRKYYGTKCFFVEEDGSIVEYTYVEG